VEENSPFANAFFFRLQETSQENAKESCLPVIRPFTAPEPIQRDNIRNLKESMQIAKVNST
jgi:hypothetical protein